MPLIKILWVNDSVILLRLENIDTGIFMDIGTLIWKICLIL